MDEFECENYNSNGCFCEITGDDCCGKDNCDFYELCTKENIYE